jgi:D-alanyl-D-alanine carboxypeptidase
MALSGVLSRRGRVSTFAGAVAVSVSIIVALSSPAEARRRHHHHHRHHHRAEGGGYSPPYAAMVVDAKTGRVLHAQNEEALRHPASVTKVMTLYLLFEQLERGRFALDTPLQVSAHASVQAPSKLGLRPGSTIEVENAIKALVTKSANDAAVVVAENIAGSEEAFAEQMTRKAHALGMTHTLYRNASGLPDPEQVTTARDLTILGRAIQDRFPRYYRYFQTPAFRYAGAVHRNHNKLLGRIAGVDGIKTGYTRASGFNLLTSARTGDRHIVAAVLGGRSGAIRDRIMASLVQTNLPRAYAGARTAPMVAEASERPRPAVVAEPQRARQEAQVDTTAATTPATRPNRQPLDINGVRPVAAAASAGTTPNGSPKSITGPQTLPQPLPAATQAYASVEPSPPARPAEPMRESASTPIQKIEGRLPEGVLARAEPVSKPESIAKAEMPDPQARRDTIPRLSASPSVAGWVIQLGAMDDEDKARSILEEARQHSHGALKKAAPFTEKIVRDGTTLFRARFSGFDEADSAQEACRVLKQSGFACFATRS